jgi:hypothetical protein
MTPRNHEERVAKAARLADKIAQTQQVFAINLNGLNVFAIEYRPDLLANAPYKASVRSRHNNRTHCCATMAEAMNWLLPEMTAQAEMLTALYALPPLPATDFGTVTARLIEGSAIHAEDMVPLLAAEREALLDPGLDRAA